MCDEAFCLALAGKVTLSVWLLTSAECGEPKLEQPLNSMKKVKEFRQSQKNQDEDGSVVGTVAGQVAAMQTLEEAAVQSLQQMQQALPKAATTEAEHQSAQWCKEKGKAITVQSEEKPFSSLVEAHFDSNMANLREAEAVKAELKKKIKKSSGQQRHVLSSSLKKKRAEIKTMKQRMFQNVLDLHTFKPREWRDMFMQTLH